VGCEQFFADVSRKIIALADPVLSQADMKGEMVSTRSFTIYHVLPDLPGASRMYNCNFPLRLYCT
jgi:hypothetical protein